MANKPRPPCRFYLFRLIGCQDPRCRFLHRLLPEHFNLDARQSESLIQQLNSGAQSANCKHYYNEKCADPRCPHKHILKRSFFRQEIASSVGYCPSDPRPETKKEAKRFNVQARPPAPTSPKPGRSDQRPEGKEVKRSNVLAPTSSPKPERTADSKPLGVTKKPLEKKAKASESQETAKPLEQEIVFETYQPFSGLGSPQRWLSPIVGRSAWSNCPIT